MLGKLLKHDFKATGKVLLPVNLIFIIVTALGCVLLASRLLQRQELLPVAIILLIAYVLVILTLTTVVHIFLIVHFYRNMFTAQGYLTFSLPASSWSLLNSKTIVGYIWLLLNVILTYLCTFLLLGAASGFRVKLSDITELFQTTTAINVNGASTGISATFSDILGYSPTGMLVLLILLVLVSCFYSVSTGYGCVAIGQLYARHKVAGTIIALVGNYLLTQIIMIVVAVIASVQGIVRIISLDEASMAGQEMVAVMQSIYKPMFPALILVYLVLGIAGYVAAGIIMKKKVNLD